MPLHTLYFPEALPACPPFNTDAPNSSSPTFHPPRMTAPILFPLRPRSFHSPFPAKTFCVTPAETVRPDHSLHTARTPFKACRHQNTACLMSPFPPRNTVSPSCAVPPARISPNPLISFNQRFFTRSLSQFPARPFCLNSHRPARIRPSRATHIPSHRKLTSKRCAIRPA